MIDSYKIFSTYSFISVGKIYLPWGRIVSQLKGKVLLLILGQQQSFCCGCWITWVNSEGIQTKQQIY